MPLSELRKNSEYRVAMAGTVRFTREGEGRSGTLPGVLLVEWPDKLRLEVQDPVGSLLALLIIDGTRFWLYDQSRKENLTGSLKSLPAGVFLSGGQVELARALLARPDWEKFRERDAGDEPKALGGEGEFVRWRNDRFVPEEWRLRGRSDQTILYEEYESRGGELYPTKIRWKGNDSNGKSETVFLVWREWEPSVPKEKKLFHLPPQQSFNRPTKALP